MLTIRLNRTGKRNRPYFRVVLQEHTKAPGKRHVEVLGSYDSMKKVAVLKKERIQYWLGQGVKASDTVHNLLIREGVIEGEKRTIKIPLPVKKEPAATDSASVATSAKEAVEAGKEALTEKATPEVTETPSESAPEETSPVEAAPAEAPEVKPEEVPKA